MKTDLDKLGINQEAWTEALEIDHTKSDEDDLILGDLPMFHRVPDPVNENFAKQHLYKSYKLTGSGDVCLNYIFSPGQIAHAAHLLARARFQSKEVERNLNEILAIRNQARLPLPGYEDTNNISMKHFAFKFLDVLADYGLLVFGGFSLFFLMKIVAFLNNGLLLSAYPMFLWLLCSVGAMLLSMVLAKAKPQPI